MSESFGDMSKEDQLSYLIENLRDLPEDLVEEGINMLVSAGEVEYAIALATDQGKTEQAIGIALENGDYLWAALIAKKAGRTEESQRLYREGLDYYVSMEMYGRAVSVARALKLPQDEIDRLYHEGIRVERRCMDVGRAQVALDSLAMTLEGALMGRDDETAEELRAVMREEMERSKRRDSE
ncbi:MAG: hypothetical protein ACXQT2_07715 [Methanotrichaceae archaeon]